MFLDEEIKFPELGGIVLNPGDGRWRFLKNGTLFLKIAHSASRQLNRIRLSFHFQRHSLLSWQEVPTIPPLLGKKRNGKEETNKTKGKKEKERERDKLPRTLFAYSTPRLPFSFTSFHQRLFNSPVGRKFFSFDTGSGGLLSTFVFHFFPSHSLSSISTVTSASQHFEKRMKKNHHHKSF